MARFPEAENRLFNVKICMRCNARNAMRGRECGKEYWIGSHWKGIEERRRRLEKRLSWE